MKITQEQLKEIIKESIQSCLNEISIDTIDSAMQKAAAETNTYGFSDPKNVRRKWQYQNFKNTRNERLGFDPDEVKTTMRAHGTTDNEQIDRRWASFEQNRRDRANGTRTYNPERGRWQTKLDETIQDAVVRAMGKYLNGKITSKEANKAIMDLANTQNKKK